MDSYVNTSRRTLLKVSGGIAASLSLGSLPAAPAVIASGDLPDVIATIDHGQNTLISQWVRDGVVTPYAGEAAAPNVTAQYEANPTLDELKVDEQIYMKPVS